MARPKILGGKEHGCSVCGGTIMVIKICGDIYYQCRVCGSLSRGYEEEEIIIYDYEEELVYE